MNNEYLLTPVIEVKDGEVLKSFRMYYLFVIAFFFGLLPALALCIRNCLWLRVKRTAIILMIALSLLFLMAQYLFLGSYYRANIDDLKRLDNTGSKSFSQQLLDKSSKNKAEKAADISPAALRWKSLKSNVNLVDRIFSLLLLLAAYFLTRRKYYIVMHLTGTVQPLLKWGIACIIASSILNRVISGLFFGGSL